MHVVLPVALLLAEFSLRVILGAVIIVRSRGTPAVRLAWLVLLLAVPVVGLVAYLLFGEARLGRRRLQRYRRSAEQISLGNLEYASAKPPVAADIPDVDRQIAYLAESVGGNIPQGGHALSLYGDTDLFIQALVQDIDAATAHCHLLFYIFLTDHSGTRVAEALIAAAGRGVACRLLVDGVGSKSFLRSDLRRRLVAGGVRVVAALPAHLLRMLLARIDLRNHRKIAVFDGMIGYSGSHNIAVAAFAVKSKYAPWVDVMVRVERPAVRDLHVPSAQDTSSSSVVQQAGNNPQETPIWTVVEAARRLKGRADIVVMVIGGGLEKQKFEAAIKRGATNIVSLPYQPMSELKYSLSAADAHVVTLGDAVVGMVHPCKVYGAMAAARPILFVGPAPSHVSGVVDE